MMEMMRRKWKMAKTKQKLLLIIDGSNLAHRAYQKFKNLKSGKGEPTGLVYGFMRLLNSYLVRFRPTYLIITFDTKQSKSSNFRNGLLGSYKVHRKNIGIDFEDFNSQLKSVKKMLKYLNVPVIWDRKGLGHESDDYIGYYAKNHIGKVMIISSDKDFCQLLEDNRVKIFNPFKEKIIVEKTCAEIMGYSAKECVDYLCLLGDKSDDIPGYKGMGPVKIRQFLDKYETIEKFLAKEKNEFQGIDRDGLADLYERNKTLIDLNVALEKYPLKKIPMVLYKENRINRPKLRELFKKYTLNSFLTEDFIKPFKNLQRWEKKN